MNRQKMEIKKMIDAKLETAKKRRELLRFEKQRVRTEEQIENFMKHSEFKKQVLKRNIEIYEKHEQEQRDNLEVILILVLSLNKYILNLVICRSDESGWTNFAK